MVIRESGNAVWLPTKGTPEKSSVPKQSSDQLTQGEKEIVPFLYKGGATPEHPEMAWYSALAKVPV
jgi:hypothetical protein